MTTPEEKINMLIETLHIFNKNLGRLTSPQFKCSLCGKKALVVFKGFSLCKAHHVESLVKQRNDYLVNELLNGDHEIVLSRDKEFSTNGFINDYNNLFGDKK